MGRLKLLDTTLRDGEQTPGVAFTPAQKIDLAKLLDAIGVDIIEAGIPAMGGEEMRTVSAILDLGLGAEVLTWNRLNLKDIQQSVDCGARHIHIAAPVSDLTIAKKINKTREWVIAEMQRAVAYCKDRDCSVSIGAEDASRADGNFLLRFYTLAAREGAARLRYADTVGIQDPFTAYEAIKKIREQIDIELDYHGHNDFGMSTANAYAAFKAGADVISCTVNGLGERAGNTPLEEIVMAARHLAGAEVNIDTHRFPEISKRVADYSRRSVHPGKAIVGAGVHAHESGIHVDGLLKDERMYQPYDPKEVGRVREFVLGKSSGKKAIDHVYRMKGLTLSPHQVDAVLAKLKQGQA